MVWENVYVETDQLLLFYQVNDPGGYPGGGGGGGGG